MKNLFSKCGVFMLLLLMCVLVAFTSCDRNKKNVTPPEDKPVAALSFYAAKIRII